MLLLGLRVHRADLFGFPPRRGGGGELTLLVLGRLAFLRVERDIALAFLVA
jgi:hypothetical protein